MFKNTLLVNVYAVFLNASIISIGWLCIVFFFLICISPTKLILVKGGPVSAIFAATTAYQNSKPSQISWHRFHLLPHLQSHYPNQRVASISRWIRIIRSGVQTFRSCEDKIPFIVLCCL